MKINELINVIGIIVGAVGIIIGAISTVATLIGIAVTMAGMQQQPEPPTCVVRNVTAGDGATVNINCTLAPQ